MMGTLMERGIAAAERRTGESADFMRDIAAASRRAAFKFALFLPLAGHRAHASPEAIAIVRIVADGAEDCGPCLRIAVREAKAQGVAHDIIRSVLAGDSRRLSPDLAAVYHYARAVTGATPDLDDRIEQVRARLGQKALVDLALAIAAARVFPTVKRALGHAVSCSRVTVDV